MDYETRGFKNENDSEYQMLKEKKEREEYLEKLKKWLDEARLRHYNICSGFSFNFGTNFSEPLRQPLTNPFLNFTTVNQQENFQRAFQQRFLLLTAGNFQNAFYQTGQSSQRNQPPSAYEFVIPPLWKRAVAEIMDFLLLLLLKVALTFILLESFDVMDMGFFGLELFQKNLEKSGGTVPVEVAVELLTLELLHRVIVCVYEAYFLKGKFCATPGKRYMGLIVITAETITPVPNRLAETVSVNDAKPLGWQKSLSRATLKNLFVGLFLPLCVAFYIFPHNRTSYDMMSKSLVVEYNQEFMVYHSNI